MFDINVNGLFYCNRSIVPEMMKRDYGRIVNIASVAGKEGNPNASAYSASKAAVIGLTKSIGKELAKTGIRVNCVTPAAVRTAIFDQITQQHIDFMLSKIPMGRFLEVGEAAADHLEGSADSLSAGSAGGMNRRGVTHDAELAGQQPGRRHAGLALDLEPGRQPEPALDRVNLLIKHVHESRGAQLEEPPRLLGGDSDEAELPIRAPYPEEALVQGGRREPHPRG